MRYKLELSYNGSNFHGWQRQPNAITIQSTIEDAFSILFKDDIQIVGCGRTDTGVHAKHFIAHFDSNNIYSENEIYKLNSYLPKDIAIKSISQTKDDFHSRFSAQSRTYEYYIHTRKNPFLEGYSWYIPYSLDITTIKIAILELYNYNDFTSFSKLHTDVNNNFCKIISHSISYDDGLLIIRITADRFLRNMVRAIIGTLVEVGRHKLTVSDFSKIISNKDRSLAGQSAPACGLYLVEVKY